MSARRTRKASPHLTPAAILTVLGLFGCHSDSGTLAGPEVAPQFANCTKNPDHPQCGGNGGDGFDGGDVITEFVTGAISGGPYQTIKKRSALSSTLEANKHNLQISESANQSICVSFPEPGAIKDPELWSDFLAMSGAVPLSVSGGCGAASGQPDSAIVALETYVNSSWFLRFYGEEYGLGPLLGPSLERLGQLHDEAGDPESAASYDARFVELWSDADPELQPRVEAARRRLQQIMDARG